MINNKKDEAVKLTDHRDIGTQLDLFSFHDVAPGAPFWHAKGMVIWRELEKVVREMNGRDGYHEISTPILLKKEVFEKSGHCQSKTCFTLTIPETRTNILSLNL